MVVIIKNITLSICMLVYYFLGYVKASFQGVRLTFGSRVSPFVNLKGVAAIGNVRIGKGVIVGEGSYINSGDVISGDIGKYCSIGYNVLIGPYEHNMNLETMSPYKAKILNLDDSDLTVNKRPPVINDDVWIGANVIILRGVTIGVGAVIGAGSVVTKNVPDYEVWAGVPARKIKERIIG